MSLSITAPLIWTAVIIAFCEATCSYPSCSGVANSGCDTTVGSNCTNYTECTVTDDDIQTILDLHNARRKDIIDGKYYTQFGGNATNMNKLTWNAEIATIAKAWVDKCNYGHDSCRNYPTSDDWVNQNIYIYGNAASGGPSIDWTGAVVAWFENEINNVKPEYFSSYPLSTNKTIGHLTQIAWANTSQIGCACSKYFSSTLNMSSIFYACNYKKGGNIVGDEVFSTTKNCSSGTTKDSDGFCVSS